MSGIEQVAGVSCTVGEGPLWWAEQNAWYWVDIPARRIWRLDAASGNVSRWATDEMAACIALDDGGGMIVGMESGLFQLSLAGLHPQARKLAAPAELLPGMRFNDGRCDRQGRFWSGIMRIDGSGVTADGHLYRYDSARGISAPVVSGMVVQNGLGFSPDGRTMYLSDSHVSRQLVWAFDYDPDSGVPSRQRVFVDMNTQRGRPDGAAVDVDGCYWICGNDAGCVLRFTPDGKLDRVIDLPVAKPSMCAFGGADMGTMLVTSISAGAPPGDALAGGVFMFRPGVQGMPEARFKS